MYVVTACRSALSRRHCGTIEEALSPGSDSGLQQILRCLCRSRRSWHAFTLAFAVLAIGIVSVRADDKKFSLNLQIGQADALSRAFQESAAKIRPSVVSIASEKRASLGGTPKPFPDMPQDSHPFFDNDLFGQLFRERLRGKDYVQRGLGSGVIVRPDGYIVTNSHVVDGADELTVHLDDGRELSAAVIGTDPRSEVAVIRIDTEGLIPAEFGDSGDLQVGQWVVAVGNPFRLSQTVTVGVISAQGRSNIGITDYENFIQTDAAINPGNSGGPLLTLRGQVIGINTAIATRTGTYAGIGFAIPSNMVRRIMNRLIEHGHMARGLLGTVIQELTPELAQSFGAPETQGVLVADVTTDGPAATAGLQSGDIITQFAGKELSSANELRNCVAEHLPGARVEVRYLRDGTSHTVQVELGALDAVPGAPQPRIANPSVDEFFLGMRLQSLTPNSAAQLGHPRTQSGVLVTAIEPGAAADDAGIRTGDIIVAVEGDAVASTEEFKQAVVDRQASGGIRMQRLRNTTRSFVVVQTAFATEQ